MNYTNEIIINRPIAQVIALFDSSENLKQWMPGLQSFEHLSGTPGEPGAKSKLVFLMGKREMVMVETIIENQLPEKFSGTYEANGTLNIQKNSFLAVDENTTRWVSHAEFRFSKLFMKLMGLLMPGAFKKQSRLFQEKFKEFAERS